MIFVTSDHHFFHRNVIRFDNRPFADLNEMHSELIKRWNDVVSNEDIALHLGDLSFGSWKATVSIVEKLRGREIRILPGNHDRDRHLRRVAESVPRLIVESPLIRQKFLPNTPTLTLCHYPLESWGSGLCIHGHSHGKSVKRPKRMDVFCGNFDWAPIPLIQAIEIASSQNAD